MSNERLGIYDELRANAERYGEFGEKIRQRLRYPVVHAAHAPPVNPFMRIMRNRIRVVGKPNAARGRGAHISFRVTWPEAKLGIRLDVVIKAVIDESEITAGEMFSDWRSHRISRPRQVAWYMIDRYCPDYSLPQIGYIFERDHTTIMAGIEAVATRLLDKDPPTVKLVKNAHQQLRALAA